MYICIYVMSCIHIYIYSILLYVHIQIQYMIHIVSGMHHIIHIWLYLLDMFIPKRWLISSSLHTTICRSYSWWLKTRACSILNGYTVYPLVHLLLQKGSGEVEVRILVDFGGLKQHVCISTSNTWDHICSRTPSWLMTLKESTLPVKNMLYSQAM